MGTVAPSEVYRPLFNVFRIKYHIQTRHIPSPISTLHNLGKNTATFVQQSVKDEAQSMKIHSGYVMGRKGRKGLPENVE